MRGVRTPSKWGRGKGERKEEKKWVLKTAAFLPATSVCCHTALNLSISYVPKFRLCEMCLKNKLS